MSLATDWLERRSHPDLDPRAERALREAGLRFSSDDQAEEFLRAAAAIAPAHEAVVIAHYRYYLYKHRYDDASRYARLCLEQSADRLGLDPDPLRVTPVALERVAPLAEKRFWLFACQAYGYVLLRAGLTASGYAVLKHLVDIDLSNESRTAELWAVIVKAGQDDDDD